MSSLTKEKEKKEIYFEKYYIITRIEATISNLSPLRVGAGRGSKIGEPDLPIVRTPDRRAVIPGSSIKGVIRNNLSRFSNLDVDKDLCYVFGRGGDSPLGSAMIFSDFVSERPIETVERAHIKINLRTGGVHNLFQVEYVPENNVFKGLIISRNMPLTDLSALMSAVTKLFNLGVIRIGGFKSRGYGIVNFDINKIQVMLPPIPEIKFKTRLGLQKGNEREINIKVENNKDVKGKCKIIENGKVFDCILASEQQLFNIYEIDKKSFYSAGDSLLASIINV